MSLPPSSSASGDVTFYFEGDDYFRDLREAVSAARSSVEMEIYYLGSDSVGGPFADLLVAKAHEGVGVKLIYDAVGCIGTSESLFTRLDHAGVELKVYHPLSGLLRLKGHFVRRNHRKYVVVDGKTAFLGGFNIAQEYSAASCGPKAWRDTGVRFSAPSLIAQCRDLFQHSWRGRAQRALNFVRGYFYTRRGKGLWDMGASILANYGWRRRNMIRHAYLTAIRQSRRRVWITNSYFIPDRALRRALCRAARRGVDVRVLTAGVSDVPIARWAGQATYGRLLAAGVKVYEFQGRVLHAKSAVVDDDWYTVGTSNLDPLSFFRNLEVNLFDTDQHAADVLADQYEKDLQVSAAIDPQAWERRPWWMKVRERVFFWLRSWL